MTSRAPEPTRWNSRSWLLAGASIFLGQFLFIYFLSAGGRPSSSPRSTPFRLQLASTQWTEAQFSKMFLTSDPSLFAVPGKHTFSGAAWLKNPVRNYDSRNLFELKEAPFWLALNPGQLGTSLNQFVRTNTVGPILRTDDAAPRIQTRILEVSNEARTNSQLRIEGELATRRLLSPLALAAWPHTNILSNSVAQVAVDQNGMVISTRLLSKSGLEKADRSAMDAARQFHFTPDNRALAWGNLIFDWHTIPGEATNATTQPKLP